MLRSLHRRLARGLAAAFVVTTSALLAATTPIAAQQDGSDATACELDAVEPTVVTGVFEPADAKTIRMLPFSVPSGTTRVEVAYTWTDRPPLPADERDRSTVDLGLWDADGTSGPDGFRGWSGDREGRIDRDMPPVWVQAGSAERGYLPGAIEPGTWNVQLGAGGVAPGGVDYRVLISCHSARTRPEAPADEPELTPDPVDPDHVANPAAGWYLGDFHLHAYHSNPKGLPGPEMADAAVAAGLDIVPVTEYVTTAHWNQLGAAQRSHPGVLIWPGREVITYHGHAIVLGETPDEVEYRPGFEGATLRSIQQHSRAEGALFGIAHPTTWPPDEFGNTCRGCFFESGDDVDWDAVDTMELHTGDIPPSPFTPTAVQFWERKLTEGHRITGVSGSDDKLGDDYGATATAVYADELSRSAVTDALRAGHAYVLVRGTSDAIRLELRATSPAGERGMFGDTLVGDTAAIEVTVTGGRGQELDLVRNGTIVRTVSIEADPFSFAVDADRDRSTEGPLGTFWRVQTRDGTQLTTIGNPVFLADAPRPPTTVPGTAATASPATTAPEDADRTSEARRAESSGSNAGPLLAGGGLVVLLVAGMVVARRRRPA